MTNAEHDDHGSDPNDTDGIRHDTDGAASGTWARVKEIFGDALELPAADRELFVWTRSESAGIAEEVLAMLANYEQSAPKGTAGFDIGQLGTALAAAPSSTSFNDFATTDAPASDLVGRIVGDKYRIDSVLGSGGMGAVFAATHVHNGKRVAVKVLHGGLACNPTMRDRFVREAHVLAALEHPNIVEIHDSGAGGDGSVYIAMALLEGRTLRDRISSDGPLAPDIAVDVACQSLDALGAAHERGVIHRDVKPPNIFLLSQSDALRVKVLDFGIAKFENAPDGGGEITREGQVPGTPQYMSPEQLRTEPLDARSDLYSVGTVIYEMLAGKPPFEHGDFLAFAAQLTRDSPAELAGRVPGVSRALSDACLRLLEKDPDDRYQTALDAARALARAVGRREGFGGDWDETADDGPSPARRRTRRRRVVVASAALVAGLAAWAGVSFAIRSAEHAGSGGPVVATNPRSVALARFDRDFIIVPGGTAAIGLDPERAAAAGITPDPDETPEHAVELGAFAIARREVTRSEYAEFVAATGRPAPESWGGDRPSAGAGNLPVTDVSWNDAVDYAAWRSERDGIRYRLPTEAEWEYAARGSDGRFYPWGDAWDASRAYANLTVEAPMPVDGDPTGTSDLSAFGLAGMAGNVSEWTADPFHLYPRSRFQPRPGDRDAVIVRGGRFNSRPPTCRTTYRQWFPPTTKDKRVGFRLAADPPAT